MPMRVCLVSLNRFVHDPRARVLARSLVHAGHDVTVIAGGPGPDRELDGASVRFVASRYPVGRGRVRRTLRRLQPAALRRGLYHRALARAAAGASAEVYHPTSAAAVGIAIRAARAGGTVAREPDWPSAGAADLITLAPARPELSRPAVSGRKPPSTPVFPPSDAPPAPGRHEGLHLALCYRKTDTNPGRYLEAALRRAGVRVDVHTDEVRWAELPPALDGAVFVESPYPALAVSGTNPGIPVLFWVHHGEHRLMTNIRLCTRYGADAVLLGHSWHLSHRFPVPVHRFPFGYAPELHGDPPPQADRPIDVAFVGAGIDDDSDAYESRREVLAQIEAALGPTRVRFRNAVTAAEMAEIYASAHIVVDEWGSKHFPITMRVFEALGSGALLVGVPAPGVEALLTPGEHFLPLASDPGSQMKRLLADLDGVSALAAKGHEAVVTRHSYDHRVDLLIEIMKATEHMQGPPPALSGLAAAIAEDVDVHRIAAYGANTLAAQLALHEVWDGDGLGDRVGVGSFDAAAVAGPTRSPAAAVESAYRFVYAERTDAAVRRAVESLRPGATVLERGDVVRFDVEGR